MYKFLKALLVLAFCFNVLLLGIGIVDISTNNIDPSVETSKTLGLNTELNRVKAEEKEIYADFSSKRQDRDDAKQEYNDLQDQVIEQQEEKERIAQEQEEAKQQKLEEQQEEQEQQDNDEEDQTPCDDSSDEEDNYEDSYTETEEYVYRNGGSSSSNIYHSSPHAHGMKGAQKMTREEAEARGYRACKRCY